MIAVRCIISAKAVFIDVKGHCYSGIVKYLIEFAELLKTLLLHPVFKQKLDLFPCVLELFCYGCILCNHSCLRSLLGLS